VNDGEREPRSEQDDLEQQDRTATGGDAEAAGSLEEREAVATDDDDLFDGDDDA
jgi:hypothetical protein